MKTKEQLRLRNTLVGTSLLFAAIYWMFFACIAQGATYQIQLALTVTNLATNGDTITINGSARTWTNTITTPSTQIRITNSMAWTATNLFTHFATYRAPGPVPIAWSTNTSNSIIFLAAPDSALTFSIGGTWASGTLSTQALTGSYVVRVPVTSENATIRTNVVSGLVAALSNTGATNQITTTAPAFAGYVTKTNGYTTNQVLQSPTLTNGVNYGTAFSSPGASNYSQQFGGGVAAHDYAVAIGYSSSASGRLGVALGSYASAGGTNSIAIGFGADAAAGTNAVVLGSGSAVVGSKTMVFGNGSTSTNDDSIVIGNSVFSARTNEIRLGGSQDVVVGGLLSVAGTLTNNAVRFTGGTMTNVSGSFSSLLATSLVAHAALLTNANVEAATIVATSLVAHAAKITNATINAALITATNLNALAATLTNASGAFSGLTATSLVAHAAKLTNASMEAAVAIVTNLTALSGLGTNLMIDRAFSTNLTISGAATVPAGANIALPATAITTVADGHNIVDVGSNAFVRLSGAGITTTWQLGGLVGDIRSGRSVIVENASGYGMLVLHESGTTPTAGQRITCGASFLIGSGGMVSFVYDSTATRWKIVSSRDAVGQNGLVFVSVGTNYNGTNWGPLTTNIAAGYYPLGAFAQLNHATSNYLALSGSTSDYTNIFAATAAERITTNYFGSPASKTLVNTYAGYYLVSAMVCIVPEVDNNGDTVELEIFLGETGQEHTACYATLATGVRNTLSASSLVYAPAGTSFSARIKNLNDTTCSLPVVQARLNIDSP